MFLRDEERQAAQLRVRMARLKRLCAKLDA